jgi:hypothetical protein
MATTAYIEDVLTLTAGLRESGLGPAVYDLAPAAGDADTVRIDLRVHADELGPVEVNITATGGENRQGLAESFAYDIWVAGTPKAVAAFLTWLQSLESFQGDGRLEAEADESERLRVWLTEPLDPDQVKVAAKSLGVEVIRIEAIGAA